MRSVIWNRSLTRCCSRALLSQALKRAGRATPHTPRQDALTCWAGARQQAPVLQELHDDAVPEAEPRAGARLAAEGCMQLGRTLNLENLDPETLDLRRIATPHLLGRGRQQVAVLQELNDDAVAEAERHAVGAPRRRRCLAGCRMRHPPKIAAQLPRAVATFVHEA